MSTITVRIKYEDNSRSLTEDFECADKHPSAEVIKDCEAQLLKKWEVMALGLRGVQIHSKVH